MEKAEIDNTNINMLADIWLVNEEGKGDDDDGDEIILLGNHIHVMPPVVDSPIAVTNNEINSRVLTERSSSPSRVNNHGLVMKGFEK